MNVSAGLAPFNTVFSDDIHGRRGSWASTASVNETSFGTYGGLDHVDQAIKRRQSLSVHAYRARAGSICQVLPTRVERKKSESEPSDVSTRTKIRINVRGKKYETFKSTLEQFPDTLLGSYGGRCRFYDSLNEELCFNRDPNSFDAILFFYQSGGSILARPSSVDEDLFADEVKFFGLLEETEELAESLSSVQEENFTGNFVNLRRKMWNIFEKNPASCRYGKAFARITMFIILLSVVAFCLETVPALQKLPIENDSNGSESPSNDEQSNNSLNKTNNRTKETIQVSSSFDDDKKPDQRYRKFWFYADTVFVVFFTAEYIARVFSSPDRLRFIRSFLSMVDFCAIAPYYISHIAEAGKFYNIKSFNVIRGIRLFRVVRLLKLSRHSSGLKILGRALYQSRAKMVSLICCIVMAIVFYSGLMYYIEGYEEVSNFESIPHTFWWAIVTMSTVGYGDIVPKSFAGKLVGTCCALTGIILLFILPIPSFVTDFSKLYERWLRKRKSPNKQKGRIKIEVSTWE
ncbi:potassium voltage-gated channel subfamily A member 2-like [Actinia tenebrosa]|uniref:Potassium voltage-gated channel subfamily A member 2-like n=1 Tax=Actinia tenebrosa TaxID=6105 RepID=A0A6P8IG00_ACTTE|nr:potassium voltage-gated channel subfamily A member 2-like [Actinia tenebrosa]XP_031565667.1 potassium voltage-gated channel subfamily A member 2-like [Actinia tenebrosa]